MRAMKQQTVKKVKFLATLAKENTSDEYSETETMETTDLMKVKT